MRNYVLCSIEADISSLALSLHKCVCVGRGGLSECCGFLLELWDCQVCCLLWLLPCNTFLTEPRAVSRWNEKMPFTEFSHVPYQSSFAHSQNSDHFTPVCMSQTNWLNNIGIFFPEYVYYIIPTKILTHSEIFIYLFKYFFRIIVKTYTVWKKAAWNHPITKKI